MLIRSLGLAAAVVFGCATFAMAQAAPREEPRPTNPPAARPLVAAQAGNLDESLATCVVLGSRNEVELCKFVRERLKTEDAKAFCDAMIKDHTAALERLEKFAGNSATPAKPALVVPPRAGAQPDPNRPGIKVEVGGVQVESRPGEGLVVGRPGATGPEAQWNQIKQELAADCLASAKSELEQAPQQDIDKCFIGLQIAAHMHMATELKVFANHASPNLRGEFQTDLQTAKQHLTHAKKIMENFKAERSTTGAAPAPRSTERKEDR